MSSSKAEVPPIDETPARKASSQVSKMRLALVTPARNEAELIELTIKAVVAQTLRPIKWIIVSDGSTDGTDDIVSHYARMHPWIELLRMPERNERHFAGKVHAFSTAYTKLSGLEFEVVGNLDADITFEEDYLEFLIKKFAENPTLGVAGTPFDEGKGQYDYRFTSREHVSGACQLFRRKCFEEIGGYVPIKTGGVDLVAVITARMHGWQTRSFPEKSCMHHRKMGTAKHSVMMSAFHGGVTDYTHGCDPLWEFCRCLYQMTRPPVIAFGGLVLCGYTWAMLTRTARVVSKELIEFRAIEQRRRLREFAQSVVPGNPTRKTVQPS